MGTVDWKQLLGSLSTIMALGLNYSKFARLYGSYHAFRDGVWPRVSVATTPNNALSICRLRIFELLFIVVDSPLSEKTLNSSYRSA